MRKRVRDLIVIGILVSAGGEVVASAAPLGPKDRIYVIGFAEEAEGFCRICC